MALKLFAADKIDAANYHEVFSDAITLISLLDADPPPEVSTRMIQVYDVGTIESPAQHAFMSMRLIRGRHTLEQPIRKFARLGGIPLPLCMDYLCQLLTPLAWMHTQKSPALHGDLKPDNILLSEDLRRVILTDFGLAARIQIAPRRRGHLLPGARAIARRILRHGGPMSTPSVWSGTSCWSARTPLRSWARRPTSDGDSQGLQPGATRKPREWKFQPAAHLGDQERFVLPSEVHEEMRGHPQLEQIMARCLAYEQHQRYGNAAELLKDIREYIATGKVKLVTDAQPVAEKPMEMQNAESKTPDQLLHDAQALFDRKQLEEASGKIQEAIDPPGAVTTSTRQS